MIPYNKRLSSMCTKYSVHLLAIPLPSRCSPCKISRSVYPRAQARDFYSSAVLMCCSLARLCCLCDSIMLCFGLASISFITLSLSCNSARYPTTDLVSLPLTSAAYRVTVQIRSTGSHSRVNLNEPHASPDGFSLLKSLICTAYLGIQ